MAWSSLATRCRRRARGWLRGLRLRRRAPLAWPAPGVVLGVDAARGRDPGDRAGVAGGVVQPLRVAIARDVDEAGVTSSLADDVRSSLRMP